MASNKSYIFILVVVLASSVASAVEPKSAEKEVDVTKLEINSDKLAKTYTKDPVFSSDSADQKERNKVIEANGETFDKLTSGHIESLYKCKNVGSAAQVAACRKEAFKK